MECRAVETTTVPGGDTTPGLFSQRSPSWVGCRTGRWRGSREAGCRAWGSVQGTRDKTGTGDRTGDSTGDPGMAHRGSQVPEASGARCPLCHGPRCTPPCQPYDGGKRGHEASCSEQGVQPPRPHPGDRCRTRAGGAVPLPLPLPEVSPAPPVLTEAWQQVWVDGTASPPRAPDPTPRAAG